MPDLNYELAPKPGMTASQRKAELDAARFVAVRNLAYMIYKKPDATALMTYQETLDNRELVKTAIINHEIAQGLLQNDLGAVAAPPSQAPTQMVPTNGATMNQQPMAPQQMNFQQPQQPQMQPAPQAPMSPQQFAQVPMQQAPQQPQYSAPPQQQQPQYAAPQMQPQQQQFQQPQMQPQQQYAAQPSAPPMEAAPVTGKKRKTAAGNSVAPPPATGMVPPGFQPQAVPAQQAAVPVTQFAPQQAQFQQPQVQFQQPAAQQMAQQVPPQATQGPMLDLTPILSRLDILGKGIEVSAMNGDQALKAVGKLQTDFEELKLLSFQMLVSLQHIYLSIQGPGGQLLLAGATEGKAAQLDGFRTYLQKYIGNPK